MSYYLSGCMRGHAGHNYALFASTKETLEFQGYDILSPHELHTQGTDRVTCMTGDVAAVLSCEGVFCLPGWEESPGANIEVAIAWMADLPVYQLVQRPGGAWDVYELGKYSVSIPRERQWYDRIPLVGLCGFAQSGKDSVAGHMVKAHDWSRIAFADALREMLWALNPVVTTTPDPIYELGSDKPTLIMQESRVQDIVIDVGWDEAKTSYPEIRNLLQRLGTEAGRDILGQNTWVGVGEQKIEASLPRSAVVSDCRFQNELAMIRRRGGTLVWVDRPGNGAVNEHASEHSVSQKDCDVLLSNDGTLEDLYGYVDLFLINLGWDPAVQPEAVSA